MSSVPAWRSALVLRCRGVVLSSTLRSTPQATVIRRRAPRPLPPPQPRPRSRRRRALCGLFSVSLTVVRCSRTPSVESLRLLTRGQRPLVPRRTRRVAAAARSPSSVWSRSRSSRWPTRPHSGRLRPPHPLRSAVASTRLWVSSVPHPPLPAHHPALLLSALSWTPLSAVRRALPPPRPPRPERRRTT